MVALSVDRVEIVVTAATPEEAVQRAASMAFEAGALSTGGPEECEVQEILDGPAIMRRAFAGTESRGERRV